MQKPFYSLLILSSLFIAQAFAEPVLNPIFSFPSQRDLDKTAKSSDFLFVATSDNLFQDITYSTDPSNQDNACSVTKTGLVHILKAGTCTITVSQDGNETYLSGSDTKSFSIAAAPANQAPILIDTKFGSVDQNKTFTGTFSGEDLNEDPLTFSISKQPAHGTISNITKISNKESTFTYTPDKNFSGTDTFTFVANDGTVESDFANGTIFVNHVDQPPEITLLGDNPLSIFLGTKFIEPGFIVLDNKGNDLSSITMVSGSVDSSMIGIYNLIYSVTDSLGLTNSATRTVIVAEENNPPVVEITNPKDNTTISGIINLSASSSDDVAVVNTQYFVDNTATSSTINTLSLTNATHTISVVVSDAGDLFATSTVNVLVNNLVVTPAVIPTVVSSGGGGGGGGGSYVAPVQQVTATTTATTTATISTTQTPKPVGKVLGASTFSFKKDLKLGANNSDVKELQKILIAKKFLVVDYPTNYFGPLTKKALIAWQKANNISPATGYFGILSRTFLNQ